MQSSAYPEAIKDELLSRKDTTNYVTHRPTTHPQVKQYENLLVERYHNQYREFDKIRRDFKTAKTLQEWNNGFRVFNNFIDTNNGEYLKGKTPAEKAGLESLGRNRWLTLLKKSLITRN